MEIPRPTPIVRLIHVDNLAVCLRRGGLHAPTCCPDDDLTYRTIHNDDIQNVRRQKGIPCGPCGVIHGYISFYFGPLSPMMLQLKTGKVPGYDGGQASLIYLVSTAQTIREAGIDYVFSDGHGAAVFTRWIDDLSQLGQVDWSAVNLRYWQDTTDDMDRKRRKQAEFLVHEYCPWELIHEIVVFNRRMAENVSGIFSDFEMIHQPRVRVDREWYYY